MKSELMRFLEQKVSPRMSRVCDFVIDGRPTWDLCCDHGLIGLWAWHIHDLPELHLVDRVPEVVAKLEKDLVGRMDLGPLFFHGVDASSLVLPTQPCNVILTGVGFRTMRRIIESVYPDRPQHRVIVSVHAERGMRIKPWTARRVARATASQRGQT